MFAEERKNNKKRKQMTIAIAKKNYGEPYPGGECRRIPKQLKNHINTQTHTTPHNLLKYVCYVCKSHFI